MEFNEDGTIKTLVPDMRGVGYLSAPQETRRNLALQADFRASSEKAPRTAVVDIETQPNDPLPEKASVKKYTRTHTYQAAHVGDESNGTRWMAAVTDSSPYITVDLKEMRNVGECQFYFTKPTEGHTWRLESLSMASIGRCVPKKRNFRHGLPMWLRVLARHVISAYIFCGEMRGCGNGKYMSKAMVMPLYQYL